MLVWDSGMSNLGGGDEFFLWFARDRERKFYAKAMSGEIPWNLTFVVCCSSYWKYVCGVCVWEREIEWVDMAWEGVKKEKCEESKKEHFLRSHNISRRELDGNFLLLFRIKLFGAVEEEKVFPFPLVVVSSSNCYSKTFHFSFRCVWEGKKETKREWKKIDFISWPDII